MGHTKCDCARRDARSRCVRLRSFRAKWKRSIPTGQRAEAASPDSPKKRSPSSPRLFPENSSIRTSNTRSREMLLRDIAHARTGDKGNIITISLIAYRQEDFSLLEERVTAERVTEHFTGIVDRTVARYTLPNLA